MREYLQSRCISLYRKILGFILLYFFKRVFSCIHFFRALQLPSLSFASPLIRDTKRNISLFGIRIAVPASVKISCTYIARYSPHWYSAPNIVRTFLCKTVSFIEPQEARFGWHVGTSPNTYIAFGKCVNRKYYSSCIVPSVSIYFSWVTRIFECIFSGREHKLLLLLCASVDGYAILT